MPCPRCAGLMVSESLEDHEGTFLRCPALRCVCCGNIVDPLILRHRHLRVAVYRRLPPRGFTAATSLRRPRTRDGRTSRRRRKPTVT